MLKKLFKFHTSTKALRSTKLTSLRKTTACLSGSWLKRS